MHLASSRAALATALLSMASTLSAATPALSPDFPATPPNPASPATAQTDFSNYAWQVFVAANWPAKAGARGVPDKSATFGAAGKATVWETYKTTADLFLANGAKPAPWDPTSLSARRTLTFHSKAPSELQLGQQIRQAVGGWLIDKNANPTYYEIAVNQTSYDYVLNQGYYDAKNLTSSATVDFPTGSLEVKAAWRILTLSDTAARFHTVSAQVMTFDAKGNPTGTYAAQTVGLVGLHLVYKAKGFPQWIWATFEQVDNAPNASSATGSNWSYFDPTCSGNFCTPNTSPQTSGASFTTPNQITRISPIRPQTAAVNATWQQAVGNTPWQYYQLISPQWPSDPNDPGNPQGTPTPGTVANTVLESYVQPTSSCMDCHSTARSPNGAIKTNYSFIFLFAQSSAGSASAPSTPAKKP